MIVKLLINRIVPSYCVRLFHKNRWRFVRLFDKSLITSKPIQKKHAKYLSVKNPRLAALRQHPGHNPCDLTFWNSWFDAGDLKRFRGDNVFVTSIGSMSAPRAQYQKAFRYAKEVDDGNFINIIRENLDFGSVGFEIDGQIVTRDLIDCTLEINFLKKHLGLNIQQNFTCLDIGAGYGRFIKGLMECYPNANGILANVVPEASFVAEYYLSE